MRLVEAENFRQVFPQVVDEIPGPAHAELAKVTQVFANLRRVEIELLSQLLRRDRLDSSGRQLVQATQIDAQTIRRQLRDLFTLHVVDSSVSITLRRLHRKAVDLRLQIPYVIIERDDNGKCQKLAR